MSQLKFLALALVFAVFSGARPTAQAGVAGDWDLSFTTPQGQSNPVTITFKQDGDKVTAELLSPFGSARLSGAERIDGKLAMTGSVAIQDLSLEVSLNGTHAGDTLSGVVTLGPLGDLPFTGKRSEKKNVEAPRPPDTDATVGPPASVAGAWAISLHVASVGEFPIAAVFEQNGDKVTGSLTSPVGPLTMIGTMAGNTLQAECVGSTPQGSFTITMNGQLGPDGFTGKASMSGFGEADWTGVRTP